MGGYPGGSREGGVPGGVPGGAPGGQKSGFLTKIRIRSLKKMYRNSVPTGRIIKYPKKCALFCPPGPPGTPPDTPPGTPLPGGVSRGVSGGSPGGPGVRGVWGVPPRYPPATRRLTAQMPMRPSRGALDGPGTSGTGQHWASGIAQHTEVQNAQKQSSRRAKLSPNFFDPPTPPGL